MTSLLFFSQVLWAAPDRFWSAGLDCSPTSVGVVLSSPESGHEVFNCFSVGADLFGLFLGKSDRPGIRANFSRVFYLSEGAETGAVPNFRLFAGPGFSLGYVRDYESGSTVPEKELERNFGGMAALSGVFGCRVVFPGESLSIDAGIMLESGFLCRKDESRNAYDVSLYLNGVRHTLSPHVVIRYMF